MTKLHFLLYKLGVASGKYISFNFFFLCRQGFKKIFYAQFKEIFFLLKLENLEDWKKFQKIKFLRNGNWREKSRYYHVQDYYVFLLIFFFFLALGLYVRDVFFAGNKFNFPFYLSFDLMKKENYVCGKVDSREADRFFENV